MRRNGKSRNDSSLDESDTETYERQHYDQNYVSRIYALSYESKRLFYWIDQHNQIVR